MTPVFATVASTSPMRPPRSVIRIVNQVRQDTRRIYGEARYQLTGQVEGRLFVVVYTHRQGEVRIISARKAKQREVRRYEDRSRDD